MGWPCSSFKSRLTFLVPICWWRGRAGMVWDGLLPRVVMGRLAKESLSRRCLLWLRVVSQLAWVSSHGGLSVPEAAKEDRPQCISIFQASVQLLLSPLDKDNPLFQLRVHVAGNYTGPGYRRLQIHHAISLKSNSVSGSYFHPMPTRRQL